MRTGRGPHVADVHSIVTPPHGDGGGTKRAAGGRRSPGPLSTHNQPFGVRPILYKGASPDQGSLRALTASWARSALTQMFVLNARTRSTAYIASTTRPGGGTEPFPVELVVAMVGKTPPRARSIRHQRQRRPGRRQKRRACLGEDKKGPFGGSGRLLFPKFISGAGQGLSRCARAHISA